LGQGRGWAGIAQDRAAAQQQIAANPIQNPVLSTAARVLPDAVGNIGAAAIGGPVGVAGYNAGAFGGDLNSQAYQILKEKGATDQQANDGARNAGLMGVGLGALAGMPPHEAMTALRVSGAESSVVENLVAPRARDAVINTGLHGAAFGGSTALGSEAIKSTTTGEPMDLQNVKQATFENSLIALTGPGGMKIMKGFTSVWSKAAVGRLQTAGEFIKNGTSPEEATKQAGVTIGDVDLLKKITPALDQQRQNDTALVSHEPNSIQEGGTPHEEEIQGQVRQEVLTPPEPQGDAPAPTEGLKAQPLRFPMTPA